MSDFQALSDQTLTIPSTTIVGSSVCQLISIIGDTVEEDDESFTVTASVVSPDIFTSPVTATVIILNDDGKQIIDGCDKKFSKYIITTCESAITLYN